MEDGQAADRLSIFISHRHVDKPLADIFCQAFENWSNGEIQVYQSSSAEHASRISEDLDEAISEAIATANIVLLVYSEAPGDMDWCMYECGLAQNPQARSTKVAVFHTTAEPPDPLAGLIAMRLDPDSVLQFAWDFHKDDRFFPGHDGAFAPHIDEDRISRRARELFESLADAAPEGPRDVPVYDHIELTLSFDAAEKLRSVGDKEGQHKAYELANSLLLDELKVTGHQGDPQEHFGFDEFADNMPLGELVDRWQREAQERSGWIEELCEAISRAVMNRPEMAVSLPLKSLMSETGPWILPVLGSYRVLPYRKRYEFDVLFCQLRADCVQGMLAR